MGRPVTLLLFLLVALLAGIPAACGGDDGAATSTADTRRAADGAAGGENVLVLDETFDSSAVEVNLGVTIEVKLAGNPATGYEWTLVSGGEPVLSQSGEPEFEPESGSLGAPGIYTWRFQVVAAGQADLKLVYSRPWEEGAPPEDTFQVSLDAKD